VKAATFLPLITDSEILFIKSATEGMAVRRKSGNDNNQVNEVNQRDWLPLHGYLISPSMPDR